MSCYIGKIDIPNTHALSAWQWYLVLWAHAIPLGEVMLTQLPVSKMATLTCNWVSRVVVKIAKS